MGLFNLFEKKNCSICGGEIGLLGNRKLEDGNLCKNCAAKLSPWFTDRYRSTVAQIQDQLKYREENKAAVAGLHITRSMGEGTKLLIDEDAGKFVITRARDLKEANPDVLDFSMVTDVAIDVEEGKSEEKTRDKDNHSVSFTPPRYKYSYDFKIKVRLNHPYFNEIQFDLNPQDIRTTPTAVTERFKPDPHTCPEYVEYEKLAENIKTVLLTGRQQVRDEARAAAAPKTAKICPFCGASTIPDAKGCCEYCGSPIA